MNIFRFPRVRGAAASLALAALALVSLEAAAGNWLPKGHYLAFPEERNLKTEMLDLLQDPASAPSSWHLNAARALNEALRTPGIRGFYMNVNWGTVEVGDGVFDWSSLDDNMAVAEHYGLKLVFKISDRSFNGSNPMPDYFPAEYLLYTSGNGKEGYLAKRWDPWVYGRIIRLYRAIGERYGVDRDLEVAPTGGMSSEAFGGIATTETATGGVGDSDYTLAKYRAALIEIVTRTQAAMPSGRLFFYLNFLTGGDHSDMNKDARVGLLPEIPHDHLIIGAPDITPDVRGMPRSVTAYRIHARKHHPELPQFCHAQHVDHGLGGLNLKSNVNREAYFEEIATVREREQQSWFTGEPAVFEIDDLRDPEDRKVDLHPEAVVGEPWTPAELFAYGRRNFACDYFLWHYRAYPGEDEFGWADVKPVVEGNACFYHPGGCEVATAEAATPVAPSLF